MENKADNTEEGGETEPEAGIKAKTGVGTAWRGRIRDFPGLARAGLRYSLILSCVFFVLYMGGSMVDPDVPDPLLFMFLRLLRYSAFLLVIFSLVAMGFSVHRMVHSPCLRNALGVFLHFLLGLLGAFLAMFSLLIVAVSRGL